MVDLERREDWRRSDAPSAEEASSGEDELERATENVLEGWPSPTRDDPRDEPDAEAPAAEGDPPAGVVAEPEPEPAGAPFQLEPAVEDAPAPAETSSEHAPGALSIPPGYPVLEGEAHGGRRAVGIVVSRFNGDVTGALLDEALRELESRGVERSSITVMPVPGAFELPIAAMALAKTRRFACIVALGCVIRGDTPHFDYVAGEAASGLQLAAIETGVPVAFGVLTLDREDQARPRFVKGAEAVRTALEMADLFANLRAAAAR
jgi:6,7-dimethyl-8-ribityllumazine synthase